MLADDAAQRGDGDLNDGVADIHDLDDCAFRIDRAAPDDGVDFDRHIILGDRFLLGDLGRHRAQIDGLRLIEDWNEVIEPRTSGALIFAEPENHRPFILVGDAQTRKKDEAGHGQKNERREICGHRSIAPFAVSGALRHQVSSVELPAGEP